MGQYGSRSQPLSKSAPPEPNELTLKIPLKKRKKGKYHKGEGREYEPYYTFKWGFGMKEL